MEDVSVSKIAVLNDEFRSTGFGATLSCDVRELPDLNELMSEVRTFNQFNEDNDPWNEHDFGRIDFRGEKVFWKIDYYDQALEGWEDPLSPNCKRLMTVMLADEY